MIDVETDDNEDCGRYLYWSSKPDSGWCFGTSRSSEVHAFCSFGQYLYCKLCIVHSVLNTMYCTLWTVHSVLYTLQDGKVWVRCVSRGRRNGRYQRPAVDRCRWAALQVRELCTVRLMQETLQRWTTRYTTDQWKLGHTSHTYIKEIEIKHDGFRYFWSQKCIYIEGWEGVCHLHPSGWKSTQENKQHWCTNTFIAINNELGSNDIYDTKRYKIHVSGIVLLCRMPFRRVGQQLPAPNTLNSSDTSSEDSSFSFSSFKSMSHLSQTAMSSFQVVRESVFTQFDWMCCRTLSKISCLSPKIYKPEIHLVYWPTFESCLVKQYIYVVTNI